MFGDSRKRHDTIETASGSGLTFGLGRAVIVPLNFISRRSDNGVGTFPGFHIAGVLNDVLLARDGREFNEEAAIFELDTSIDRDDRARCGDGDGRSVAGHKSRLGNGYAA